MEVRSVPWRGTGWAIRELGSHATRDVCAHPVPRQGTERTSNGTFVINITACVIIGFSLAFLGRRTDMNPAWRFLVPIGFVGAYSTFSTFEWEIFSGLQAGASFIAALYVVLSLSLGLLGVWCGVMLARVFS